MIFSTQNFSYAFIIFVLTFLVSRYRRLQSIPGPLLASFTDLWRAYHQNFGNFSEILVQLHKTHGPFVRVGPNTVSVGQTSAMSSIYTMHGEFRKADSYNSLRALTGHGEVRGSIIDMNDEKSVTALKRAIGGIFSAKNVLDYEHEVDEIASTLMDRISNVGTINLFQTLLQFQVDFLMKIAFTDDSRYLEEEKDAFQISSQPRLLHWMQWQSMPNLEHLIYKPPFLRRFLRSEAAPWAQMASQKLYKRRSTDQATTKKQTDLLDKYLDAAEKHKTTVDATLIQRTISSTISAGYDTTAFTLTIAIYFLIQNPQAQATLRKEVEDAFSSGRLSNPPTFKEVEKLEYLAATIKESLRCWPFLNIMLERTVPKSGATVINQWLPGGTVVGSHPRVVHFDPGCFGNDVDEFRPERWLIEDNVKKLAMERAFLGFGSGKRLCLGRHLAEMEIKKIIPSLLLNFQMSLKDPETKLESMDRLTSFPKDIIVTFSGRT